MIREFAEWKCAVKDCGLTSKTMERRTAPGATRFISNPPNGWRMLSENTLSEESPPLLLAICPLHKIMVDGKEAPGNING